MERLSHIPRAAAKRLALHVSPAAERALRQGHPWLFAGSIRRQSGPGEPGDLAVVFDRRRRFLAIGLYDPTSPLRVRLLQHGRPATIDAAWLADRLAASVERRRPLLADPATDGYRLVHGENDGLPGLVVDRYAATLVLKLYTLAWLPWLADVAAGLTAVLPAAERLVLRLSRALQAEPDRLYGLQNGQVLHGPPLEGPVIFRENGLRFESAVAHGQKTGFFLDQRENRARLENLAAGRSVLNVFAYTGGFALYAARGGARRVVSLDMSGPALAAAERNFALNPSLTTPHETRQGNAFSLLAEWAANGRLFDLVVLDPPALARQRSEIDGALAAYRRLVRLGLALLAPAGILVMASCSSRVDVERFYSLVNETAAAAGRPLTEIARTGHPLDHPIGFAEGAYLKCLFSRAP